MPCYDPETHERPIRLEKRVHELTALLCYACSKLSPEAIASEPNLAAWWHKHKTHDDRIAALKAKRAQYGYAALTPAERGELWTADDVSY